MPECLLQPKGNIASPLPCMRNFEMPGETMQGECFSSAETMTNTKSIEDIAKGSGRRIKEEQHDASSLLYTLAAAAASRSSSPNTAIKQEVRSSMPVSDHNVEGLSLGRKPAPSSDYNHRNSKTEECLNIQANANGRTHKNDEESLSSFQHKLLGSKKDGKNVSFKQTNQLHLMEAMMQRQRQLYEEYGHSNWMKMQRNDSNCLSKSKAKRYRWCVQKDQENEIVEDNHVTASSTTSNQSSSSEHVSSPNSKKKIPTKRGTTTNGPVHDKLYGTVFTGASKFRCRDCGKSFSTLVDLTVHMSKTGHYRDQNIAEMKGCGEGNNSKFAKPKKRSMMEMEEKESAEKVLKCLGCGHSFDSLQDLTVHMIKTKHYEDVPSLRIYSQKNEFCAIPSGNGLPPATMEDKTATTPTQRLHGGNAAVYPIRDPAMDSLKYASSLQDPGTMNLINNPAFGNAFASQPHFANMLSMAALRLIGSFPPYLMQMPFPNAMGGYDMASAAYAAAAARLFLSSPWLNQMPAMGATGMFSPFLNPSTSMPPTMMSQSSQQSPATTDISVPPHSAQSTSSSTRCVHLSSPEGVRTPNGSTRDSEDSQSHKTHVLRCVQCGESFSSLQKMTDHMRETTHFPIAMTPPSDDNNIRRGSRCSSRAESIVRSSPKETASSIPTASPLEELAKLASGKSLSEMNGNSSGRTTRETENMQSISRHTTSPHNRSPCLTQPSHGNNLSGERYIRPTTPRKGSDSPLTGSDFIKSLESTIQSAISRVNQPSTSPSLEKQTQSSGPNEQLRVQKSRKHHILQSFAPTTSRIHRKSLPNEYPSSRNCLPTSEEYRERKIRERPASDGEEYYRSNDSNSVNKKNDGTESPPLDLSKPAEVSGESPLKPDETSGSEATGSPISRSPGCINKNTDDLQISFESNARKRWEKKKSQSISPTPNKRPRRDDNISLDAKKDYPKSMPIRENPAYENLKSDPLKEMQRIVNATEISVKDSRPAFMKQRDNSSVCQKRKIDQVDTHGASEAKCYKSSSVLSDLVRHDDNDQPPALNPLTQMEHLVNLKIGRNSNLEKSKQSKKQNLAKPYFPTQSDAFHTSMNSATPMSALLNLFQGTNAFQNLARLNDGNEEERERNMNPKSHRIAKVSEMTINDRSKNMLNEKMAEIVRSMITGERPPQQILPENSTSKTLETAGPSSKKIEGINEIQLQALFTVHLEKKSRSRGNLEHDMESISNECGISVDEIKKWMANTEKQLSEKKKCEFLDLSEPDSAPSFRCTFCAAKSAQGLSARDFLSHLSTHIRDEFVSEDSADGVVTSNREITGNNEWEMMYKGAVHFKSLKADSNNTGFSLTAHVTESRARPTVTNSPELDIVAEQQSRTHVDVIDESPIKVSG